MRQKESESKLVNLSVRVSKETADRLRLIADREYRSVARELRRLIEERVAEDDLEKAA